MITNQPGFVALAKSQLGTLIKMGIVAEECSKRVIDRWAKHAKPSAFATHPVKVVEVLDVSIAAEVILEIARAR